MFGKGVLQPFRLFASERRASAALYGYAAVDVAELRHTADAVATPDCLDVLNPETMRSKRMPSSFERGRRLGFDLRLRPVRRLRRDLADAQLGHSLSKGAEVDAFRVEVLQRFPSGWDDSDEAAAKAGITRQSVYAEWLSERFGDAVSVEQCRWTRAGSRSIGLGSFVAVRVRQRGRTRSCRERWLCPMKRRSPKFCGMALGGIGRTATACCSCGRRTVRCRSGKCSRGALDSKPLGFRTPTALASSGSLVAPGVWGAMERKVRLATAVSGVSERPELAPSDRFRYGERVASQQVDVLVAER